MFQSFDEEVYDSQLSAIKEFHAKSELPNRVLLIEDIRIECESTYPVNPAYSLAIRGYTRFTGYIDSHTILIFFQSTVLDSEVQFLY
jgi:hypothetical protein